MILLMLLAALNVGNFNAPLTQEEQATKECHSFCDGVEGRISQHISDCRTMTDAGACNGNITVNNHGMSDLEDRS